jgi:uncharacterized protein YigE (DUF2233 family)
MGMPSQERSLVFEQHTPYLSLSLSTSYPLGDHFMLSVWANVKGKRTEVLNRAWNEADVVQLISFRRGAWPAAKFATQSGPMLVIDGAIHPAFIVNSTDRKPRNGVGVSSPTQVHFVITQGWVNFYDFARFFRDGLGCNNALFLDGGQASGLYAPALSFGGSRRHETKRGAKLNL